MYAEAGQVLGGVWKSTGRSDHAGMWVSLMLRRASRTPSPNLHRLAQPHFIGQDQVALRLIALVQPVQALQLNVARSEEHSQQQGSRASGSAAAWQGWLPTIAHQSSRRPTW